MSLTLYFSNVYIQQTGNYAGITEAKGPLGHLLDGHSNDLYDNCKNYELAERSMTKKAIQNCLLKANMNQNSLQMIIQILYYYAMQNIEFIVHPKYNCTQKIYNETGGYV